MVAAAEASAVTLVAATCRRRSFAALNACTWGGFRRASASDVSQDGGMTKGPVEILEGHHPQWPVPWAPTSLCSILAAAIDCLEAASVTYCLPLKIASTPSSFRSLCVGSFHGKHSPIVDFQEIKHIPFPGRSREHIASFACLMINSAITHCSALLRSSRGIQHGLGAVRRFVA